MVGSKEPSFGWVVLKRAGGDTLGFLRHLWVGVALVGGSLATGSLLFGGLIGWSTVKQEWIIFIAFTLAPAGLFVFAAFLWNLSIAGEKLIYEAIGSIQSAAPSQEQEENTPPVSLRAYQIQSLWDVMDLASILSALDDSSLSYATKYISWKRTILDAMNADKLKYIAQRIEGRGGYYRPSDGTKIRKADAIEWAEGIKFDMSQLK
jgi:hypothetical protein